MFAGDDWMHPVNHAAAIAPTITDELHAMLVKCADDLEGCASFPSDRIYVWPRRHLTAFVFEGNTDLVASRPGGLLGLSNRLILPDQKFAIDNRFTACLAC